MISTIWRAPMVEQAEHGTPEREQGKSINQKETEASSTTE